MDCYPSAQLSHNPIPFNMNTNTNNSTIDKMKQQSSPASPKSPTKQILPKIYRTHQERKQSKLMHSLGVNNIHKLTPTQETKQML